jgi:flagellar biosynthesis protein FlhF
MEEKIFQAQSMLEALEKVQSEMGPEAVVVSVREIQSPAWSLHKRNIFEVKAAPAGTEVKPKSSAAPTHKPKPAANPLVDDASTIEWVAEEKQGVSTAPRKQPLPASPRTPARPDSLLPKAAPALAQTATAQTATAKTAPTPAAKTAPAAVPTPPPGDDLPAGLLKLKQALAAQDLDLTFLDRIFELAHESLSPLALKNEETVKKYVIRQLEAELRVSPPRDLKPPAPVVCLVGTSGSGKTSMAARLAMHYSARMEKKVAWICADVIRAGAIAEARTYTDALSLPLTVVYTPADLRQALSDTAGTELTLIDLPGYNPLDENQVAELGAFLAEIPNRCLMLVASASQKEKDLFQAAASFGIFGLNGLTVTKMDETLSLGSIYNLAQKSQIPLVYFSSGKGTTGSFQSASAERLVSALFSHGAF